MQARMLSGRYRTEKLRRHWSDNKEGHCLLPSCHLQCEDLPHILLVCPSLQEARDRVKSLWIDHLKDMPDIGNIVTKHMSNNDHHAVQLIVDPSVIPEVIRLTQEQGDIVLNTLFYLTRTFCYSVHVSRLKLLGLS